ncbi:YheC/YheD family endospore coat-associated protein [Cohnella abietis]|uniref:Endospore coat-associated protein YheC n=1 Tax=Cohnella abietis TaxID=2507935 RepID=A0A3T1D337_9BACL|nr:YheC/YheD family protein [Cohnella abietis]BBI32425.1 endospore coat-associated protein YheC [Cohnella abietis]
MPAIYPDSRLPIHSRPSAALGVLVCEHNGNPPFAESSFIRRLNLIGAAEGLTLFAFSPWTWDAHTDSVKGWVWNERKQLWVSSKYKLPTVVYDRSWPETEKEKQRYQLALQRIRAVKRITFLNNQLPNKEKVHQLLLQERALRPILPPTMLYKGPESLVSWLRKQENSAFLKPVAGSQGRRVIAIVRSQDGMLTLSGRHSDNRPFTLNRVNEAEALQRLDGWIGKRRYIMQPLLELKGLDDEPFDLRALMQKNNKGRWTLTGIAARVGAPGTVTSNLHGGGIAASAKEALTTVVGEQRGSELLQEINKMCFLIVTRLEQSLGRFAEIGLDYGVERSGKLWFLEANSKPGRAAMGSAGKEAAHKAAEQPLSYARSILLRPPGRVIHEFDHL